ncbi:MULTISPECIES: ABC transporter permease [Paenibacillus]|uniref:Putative aldouronate transport system permease protein n=1 Tax=Paenibacillus pabuli TaxID=1472 RepID=A0A855XWE8_9BACL|nr:MULTISPECIES: ABC transporter permease subunit [Paenibacillus]NEU60040.1 sugar ABC transporter permease [Paenibacillus sp. ALJ109b]PWW38853.1 putative aldouronate transport system permease protein [Paenibacillus pabuli]PXW06038.1 putative aldouronate transport system permease protein [Paenibacillus taichungensis]SDK25495.1 putative aldouronate transport system permease protein [Paenibacillus sp. OK060]SEA59748.1 putative aldouronate transport system permease protein [Paenibacillus sp. 276b]
MSNRQSFRSRFVRDFMMNKYLYIMMIPVIGYYLIFHYGPMYGAIIAFKDYSPMKGILGSDWVGLKHFEEFFNSYYFLRVLKNTLLISLYTLVFEFPAPIILALLINEVRKRAFKRVVQTITYMPYFISLVVICGIITDFTNADGLINRLIMMLGYDGQAMLQKPELFRPIYVLSEIWQRIGWESIIYIAALMSIDLEQYEAAKIDGASRLKQMFHITLPGLLPIITIMFILRMGNMLNVGFEKIILLYNPVTYETADVISSFVYRKGLLEFGWSYSSAVGLFNSVINLVLLISANYISRRVSQNSLW